MLRLVVGLIFVTLLLVFCQGENDHQHHPCPTVRPCICNGIVVTPSVPLSTPVQPDGVSPVANQGGSSSSEESSEEHHHGHNHGHDHTQDHAGHNHGQGSGHNHGDHNHEHGSGHNHSDHNHEQGSGHNHHHHHHHRCPTQPPCVCPQE